jgi:deazaflavin-dependent oxidoreductase (nitroreductase family)
MDYEAFTRAMKEDLRTNGQITSGPMAGRPIMILTTTGAKSGQPREAIITYTRDHGAYVIAASKSGAPTNPAWYHNILANPQVTVETGGETFTAMATVVKGAERDRLWNQHAEERPEFKEYPKITDRVIPVITLQRVA